MRYPRAERFAREMPLPLVANEAVRELYGYVVPALDSDKAKRILASAGYLVGTPAHDAAISILEERVALLCA